MADYLLDTGILIRHLRRCPGYREAVSRLASEGDLYIASFTRLEVIRGMREHEREVTFALLNALLTVPLDVATADLAGEMTRTWRGRGIMLSGPDAVIAASALQCGAILVTTNPRHFPMPELTVYQMSEDGVLIPRTAPS